MNAIQWAKTINESGGIRTASAIEGVDSVQSDTVSGRYYIREGLTVESCKAWIKCGWISDPGHAWLRVPLWALQAVNCVGRISSFSYMKLSRSGSSGFAYLEEDADAFRFIQAAMAHEWLLLLYEYENWQHDQWPGREFDRFSVDLMPV